MNTSAMGFLIGLAFGAIVSFFNYLLIADLVKKYNANENKHTQEAQDKLQKGISRRFLIRIGINVVALGLVFLLRNIIPLPFSYVILGTAIGLSVPGRFFNKNLKLDELDKLATKEDETIDVEAQKTNNKEEANNNKEEANNNNKEV